MPDSEPTATIDKALEAVVVEGYSKVAEDGNAVEDFGAPKSEKPSSGEREELSPVFEEIRTQGNERFSSARQFGGECHYQFLNLDKVKV